MFLYLLTHLLDGQKEFTHSFLHRAWHRLMHYTRRKAALLHLPKK